MDKVAYRSAGTRALPKSHTNSLSAEDDLPHSNQFQTDHKDSRSPQDAVCSTKKKSILYQLAQCVPQIGFWLIMISCYSFQGIFA